VLSCNIADVLNTIEMSSPSVPLSAFSFQAEVPKLASAIIKRYDISVILPSNVFLAAEPSAAGISSSYGSIIAPALFLGQGPALISDIMEKCSEGVVRKVGKGHLEELSRELRQ
jgi:hypothetical protein